MFHQVHFLSDTELELSGVGEPPDSSSPRGDQEAKRSRHNLPYGIQKSHRDDSTVTGSSRLQTSPFRPSDRTWSRLPNTALEKNILLDVTSSDANCIETNISYEGKKFYASFVYGNTDRNIRRAQWNQLVSNSMSRDAAWFVTKDFNDLLNSNEKVGGLDRPEGSFSDLRTFFSEGDLYDLRHSRDLLSWRRQHGENFVRCRLD